jgi:DNA polymerase (family 10)
VLDKFGIAAALQEIAGLLELRGGVDRFKARAYRAGARSVAGYSGDIAELVDEDRLTSLRGVGAALASQIKQLHLSGKSSVLESLRKEFPPGVLELATVPGLTLSRIQKLHQELGISSISELKKAAEAGTIRNVPGFGVKTEQRLIEALNNESKSVKTGRRIHLHHAERVAESILDYLRTSRGVLDVNVAGSLRRWKETVGLIRFVASSRNPAKVIEHFLQFPLIVRKEEQDEHSCTVELLEGVRISLTAVTPEQFPVALLSATGSAAHFAALSVMAQKKGLTFNTTNSRVRSKQKQPTSERDIYDQLGMQFIPPELRENEGEIEAALKRKLPTDLIEVTDIQGMVHCHTTYSDGVNSVEEMARAADALGMKYMTITDHSPTAFYAGGLSIEQLYRQWDEIDEVQQKVKVKLLRGTESDIVANGSLDYPDRILEQFDVIVASIHSRYKMDSAKMTRRIMHAMRQPVFKIWGHALGRLLERRPPFECDVEGILDVIAESKAAVEINGDPYRLDLEPRWVREARKRGIKVVISVDAHSTGALNNVKYGVAMARRSWIRKRDVLNALSLKGFTQAVRPVQ